MRQDMKKVIIERPRIGGDYNSHSNKKLSVRDLTDDYDIEDNRPNRSAKRDTLGVIKHVDNQKQQTDLLSPLRRWLRKQVGRPWNIVWSEICENNKDFMGEHLKTHVGYEVEIHCYMEDGKVMGAYGYEVARLHDQLYVHPETGLLQLGKAKNKYRYEPPKYKIFEHDGQEYYKHDGIWYRVKVEAYTLKKDATWSEKFYTDVFGHHLGYRYSSHQQTCHKQYGKSVKCTWKQQANSKECKRLNEMAA